MRKRPVLLAAAALAAGLAVFRTVEAQTPQPGGYLPKSVTTVPPGSGSARPYSDWSSPPGYSTAQPGKTGAKQPGYLTPPAGQSGKRLTSPVVAGADGVRPASADDIPPPTLEMPAPPGETAAAPKAAQDPPAVPPLGVPPVPPAPLPTIPVAGEPQKPVVPVAPPTIPPTAPAAIPAIESGGLKVTPQPAVDTERPTPPAAVPLAGHGGGALPAKQTQTVTLEAICPDTVGFGGELRYELVVKNGGTAAAVGVRVEDEVPAGATYVGSDPPAEVSGGRLTWAVGTLDAGAEKRIAVRVKPSVEGELASKATVSYAAAVEARTKVTRPRIALTVTGSEVCKAGEEAVFQIRITNSGTGPAQQMVLQALLSEGLQHPQGYKLEMAIASLAAGESKTIPLRVTAGKAGLQVCQVTVAATGIADTASKASVNVVEPVLNIAQTGPAKCFVRGSEPVYEIKLSNTGTAATDAITMYSVLPEGFEYVEASDSGSYSAANRAVVWKVAALAPGANKAFTLKVRATAAGEGMLRTIAQSVPESTGAVGAGGVAAKPAGKPLEAKADTAIKAEGVAAVRFEVIDLDDPVETGKEAVYEIRVVNQGTGACTNVQLVAALAEGAAYTGSSGPTQVKAAGQSLIFDPIATLAAKGEVVYRVKVRGTVAGDLRFRVQLTCDQVRTPVVKEESTRFFKE